MEDPGRFNAGHMMAIRIGRLGRSLSARPSMSARRGREGHPRRRSRSSTDRTLIVQPEQPLPAGASSATPRILAGTGRAGRAGGPGRAERCRLTDLPDPPDLFPYQFTCKSWRDWRIVAGGFPPQEVFSRPAPPRVVPSARRHDEAQNCRRPPPDGRSPRDRSARVDLVRARAMGRRRLARLNAIPVRGAFLIIAAPLAGTPFSESR